MRKPFVTTTRALSADALTPPIHFPRATDRGLSALAMLAALPPGASLTTVDVKRWDAVEGTFLRDSDFAAGRLAQVVRDFGS